jgi:outer membrane receptor protein involved in Fe transport
MRRHALASAALALAAAQAAAQSWEVTGSAGVREEYNTNWRLVAPPYPSVWITTLFGTVAAARRSELSSVELSATVNPFIVVGESGANRMDVSVAAQAARTSERDELALRASFLRDSTLLTEFTKTGVALTQAERDLLAVQSSWTHRLSERWRSRLAYAYSATRYEQGVPGLVDFDYRIASATLTYAWSERIEVFARGGYSLYETRPAANRTASTELGAGVSGRFTERLSGTVSASVYRADIATVRSFLICPAPAALCTAGLVQPVPVRSGLSIDDTGFALDGSLEWRADERTTLGVSGGQSLQPSGSGAVYAVRRAAFGLSRELSETVAASAGVSVTESRLVGASAGSASDQRTYGGVATIAWRFARNWRLEAGVRYTRIDYPAAGTDVSSTAIFASTAYVFDPVRIDR